MRLEQASDITTDMNGRERQKKEEEESETNEHVFQGIFSSFSSSSFLLLAPITLIMLKLSTH